MPTVSRTVLVALLLAGPVSASAELLRIEYGSVAASFPRSLEEVEARLRAMRGVTVTWVDTPWYDAWYTGYGGAHVGSVQFNRSQSFGDSVTWLQCDNIEAAEGWLRDSVSWASTYYASACDAEFCVQVYAGSGAPGEAEALLDALLGR